MKNTIFIPKKIKIGFNPRTDTYTGKLGYVIYHDGKKWRKEDSWEGWRYHYSADEEFEAKKQKSYDNALKQQKQNHKYYIENDKKTPNQYYAEYAKLTEDEFVEKTLGAYSKYVPHDLGRLSSDIGIKPVEYDNTPMEGFVLNKKVGGDSRGWDHRQTYCRVYDPRGFEFEIVIPNLLYILENATSTKGKGLEGKFVYGWDGKDLVLIPEEAPEFKEMIAFTELQEGKIKKKDLKIGGIYLNASNNKVTYLGEAKYYDYNGVTDGENKTWFCEETSYKRIHPISVSSLKKYVGDNPDIANLLDKMEKEPTYTPKVTKVLDYELWNLKALSEYYQNNRYYSWNCDIYLPAKTKGKYISVRIMNEDKWVGTKRESTFYLQKGRKGSAISEKFESLEKLVGKHPLYKQIQKDEKKDE